MAETVYALCLLASLVCAALLLKNYRHTRLRLILWTGLCFSAMALNNLLLLTDLLIGPLADLSIPRVATAVIAVGLLLYGMITEVT
ncbi:DUF5985 family protein [Polyangium sorediatum]|uniref:DUF5985 family protein n=1 Tax=Polyangium sorediatum TaxID=889274 RepID=A0ABT6NUJ9_9BACT|nr:DUF5985 family protein [Polyangium sorediatum]MDI1432003.1 DUF5985 family protein [Polyangium sorediatum]